MKTRILTLCLLAGASSAVATPVAYTFDVKGNTQLGSVVADTLSIRFEADSDDKVGYTVPTLHGPGTVTVGNLTSPLPDYLDLQAAHSVGAMNIIHAQPEIGISTVIFGFWDKSLWTYNFEPLQSPLSVNLNDRIFGMMNIDTDAGTLTIDNVQSVTFTATAVPEPTLGLVPLAFLALRRRR